MLVQLAETHLRQGLFRRAREVVCAAHCVFSPFALFPASALQRELRPLLSIRDHYPKYILTMDDDPEEQYDGIRRINARDWLLGLTD